MSQKNPKKKKTKKKRNRIGMISISTFEDVEEVGRLVALDDADLDGLAVQVVVQLDGVDGGRSFLVLRALFTLQSKRTTWINRGIDGQITVQNYIHRTDAP
jgi:hypothetical protein